MKIGAKKGLYSIFLEGGCIIGPYKNVLHPSSGTLGATPAQYHFMDKRSRYEEIKSNRRRDDLKDKIFNKK